MRIFFPFYFIAAFMFACESSPDDCSEYHDNGKLALEVFCDEDGIYNGEMKMYHANGNIKAVRYFSDGVEIDTARYFDKEGLIKQISPMAHGLLHGRVQWFRPDGTLEKEADYEQGKLHGEELLYHEGGKQISRKRSYVYDILYGPYAQYAVNGVPIEDGMYYNQMRFEQWKKYRSDGSVAHVFTYNYHKKDGHFAIYRPSGIPYITGTFVQGFLSGEVSYYDKDGSIINLENWINGENVNYNAASGMPKVFGEDKAGFKVGNLSIKVSGDTVTID